MSYQNFAVEVTALPNGNFRIAVQSPVGEASAQAASPFTPEELERLLKILSREEGSRLPRLEEAQVAREVGQRLFAFLFQSSPELSNAWFGSLRDAMNSDGLRIRLSVENAGILSSLPWELLRDPSNDFLVLSRRTPVVRYTQQLNTRPPATVTLPLRVLVMISAPENFPALDVEGEWRRLQEATAPLRERGLLELERLDTATLIALQRRLRQNDYHIFHYVGHSAYDAASHQGLLVFENEGDNRQGEIITGTALSRELAEESTVRLVVLNSCQSASRPPTDALAGIASSLVARGIPAVAGMQFAISDGAAKAFAEEFYRALADMMPLDAAMSEARRAIANRIGNSEWATPVLYLRAADGVLFQPAPNSNADATTPPPANRRALVWSIVGIAAALLVLFTAAQWLIPPPPPPTPTPSPTPSALPDLQIGNLRTSPRNPAPGQIFMLSITITNAGNAPSGAFNWAWDASQNDPVLLNSLDGRIDNIAPGASKSISFPYSYGWWGTYISQLKVDADSEIIESDKRNNNRPFEINLALLPFEMDFSLLPPNLLPEPPVTVTAATFQLWNLAFALDTTTAPDCAGTPLQLVESGADIVLTTQTDNPTCAALPVSVTVLRDPVRELSVDLEATSAGTIRWTSFADLAGTQVIAQGQPVAVSPGEIATVQALADGIRRLDLSVENQTTRITRVVLVPEPQDTAP